MVGLDGVYDHARGDADFVFQEVRAELECYLILKPILRLGFSSSFISWYMA